MNQARSPLRIASLLPELLGTYGDGGNAMVLARRARLRGIEVMEFAVSRGDAVPDADIYLLGGGEDGPQVAASLWLAQHADLASRLANGAVVLGVCAGFQILGEYFPAHDGIHQAGLGLLDMRTERGGEKRCVGELAATIDPAFDESQSWLSGFENHAGRTSLGEDLKPLGRVLRGVGNGGSLGTEGAWTQQIVGTYLHGPVLARNPVLADKLLGMVNPVFAEGEIEDGTALLREERRVSLALKPAEAH